MRKIGRNDPCPCGTGDKFKKCCGPALDGAKYPQTPEALMRSRYSAFVTGNPEYLYNTTHPDNEQVKEFPREQYLAETLQYCRQVDFLGLTVLKTWPADEQGTARVMFTAWYRLAGEEDSFTELSSFVQQDGRWVYLAGVEDPPEAAQAGQ